MDAAAIISSNCASIPEVVENAAILLDDPHSKEELLNAMFQMKMQTLRKELIRRGLVREKIDWKRWLKKQLKYITKFHVSSKTISNSSIFDEV